MGEKMTEPPTYIPINEIKIESDKDDLRDFASVWNEKHERIKKENRTRSIAFVVFLLILVNSLFLQLIHVIPFYISISIILIDFTLSIVVNFVIHKRISRIIDEGI